MEIIYYNISDDDIPHIAEMELKYFGQPWSETGIRRYVEEGNMIFIVAKDKDMIAGYCAVLKAYDEGDLVSIAVDEDHRRTGIARELLDIACEMAQEQGIETIHLEVRGSNEAAIGLYESEGFVRSGLRKGFYSNPKEDALLYLKKLK